MHLERIHHLQAAVILAMTLDRTLVEGVEPESFVGPARDAFKEIQAVVAGTGTETVHLDYLLESHFGVVRRNGEKIREAVQRRLKQLAESRKLETEYKLKRFQIAKGK